MRGIAITLAVFIAIASAFLLGSFLNTPPAAGLIHMGLRTAVGPNHELETRIAVYQQQEQALRLSIAASETRAKLHRREAQSALADLRRANERAEQLEASEPAVREHVEEAASLLARVSPDTMPEPCQPFYEHVATLRADLEWAFESLDAEKGRYAALNRAFVARDLELAEVKDQRHQLRGRLEQADKLIRRVKRSGRKVKIVGVGMVAAGIFLAVR